jgi:hypothetical protein
MFNLQLVFGLLSKHLINKELKIILLLLILLWVTLRPSHLLDCVESHCRMIDELKVFSYGAVAGCGWQADLSL